METECSERSSEFQPLAGRQVTAQFNGGTITSDAGALLLGEIEVGSGLMAKMAACFNDHRDPEKIEHTVEALLKQRVFALALGYEGSQRPRSTPGRSAVGGARGKADPTGQDRADPRDREQAAGRQETSPNWLELTLVGCGCWPSRTRRLSPGIAIWKTGLSMRFCY